MKLLTLSSTASWPLASALKKVCRDGIACAINCKQHNKNDTTEIYQHTLRCQAVSSGLVTTK